MLVENGYDVRMERDLSDAIDAVKAASPEVVISELAAPNVDGLKLCSLLRSEAGPGTQVLLVGDLSKRSSIVADGLDIGAVDYLQKPVDQIALYERCSALLGMGGECDEPADETADTVTMLDADGRVLIDDRGGELTGRLMSEFIHPSDAAEFGEFISSAVWLGEACGSVEYRFRRGDGSWSLIESTARAIEHPRFGAVVVLDSCEKSHGRFSLGGALNNEMLRSAMFDNASMGMAILSPSGHVVETNHALRQMLDHPVEELHGMALAELIIPRDQDVDRRALAEVMSGRRSQYRFRNAYYLPNGETMWGELTVVALPADDEEPFLMVVFEDPFAARPEFEFCSTSPESTAHPATNVLDITRWKVARGLVSTN